MKKIFGLLIIILFSCDNEIPIEDNFVVEAFLFQGEKVDDVRIKETKLWNSEDSIDTYIGNANIKIYGNGSEYSLEYNSTEGNYFIEVYNGNNCYWSELVEIPGVSELDVQFTSIDPICDGSVLGEIDLTISNYVYVQVLIQNMCLRLLL